MEEGGGVIERPVVTYLVLDSGGTVVRCLVLDLRY